VAGRSHGRWLNHPWYTDWVVWVTAAAGVVGVGGVVALTGDLVGLERVAAVVIYTLAVLSVVAACGALLALARTTFLVVLRVKPGRERVLTFTVRLKELGASVKYTRHPDGVVTAAVRGVPLRRRLEALAAAHAHAERHGILQSTSVEEDAPHPPGQ
jgi:hypothetical protein